MTDPRASMLTSIRTALGGRRDVEPPAPPKPPVTRTPEELADRFEAEAKYVGVEVHRGDPRAVIASLGTSESIAVTRADWALADSGTVVEYHGPGSPSSASALADLHVAIVPIDRILPDVATFYRQYRRDLAGSKEPHYAVFITGPSRTADIEQTLVLGAHGPRRLVAVIAPPGWREDPHG